MGLDLVKKLNPVQFKLDPRDRYVRECQYDYGLKSGVFESEKYHYGLIAQEISSSLSELGLQFDQLHYNVEEDAYRLNYEQLIAPLILAIKQLDEKNTALEARLTAGGL
jgi:hypothetical protein